MVTAKLGRHNRKVILGLGNLLQGDEGFGIHAITYIWKHITVSAEVDFVDGGVLGMNLLPLVEECSHLMILDAINAGAPPGSVIELTNQDIPLFAGIKLSEHQIGFQEVLGTANFRSTLPTHLHLIGVQPENIALGTELSLVVNQSLQEVLQRTISVLRSWGVTTVEDRSLTLTG